MMHAELLKTLSPQISEKVEAVAGIVSRKITNIVTDMSKTAVQDTAKANGETILKVYDSFELKHGILQKRIAGLESAHSQKMIWLKRPVPSSAAQETR